jgi:hypothetical protein
MKTKHNTWSEKRTLPFEVFTKDVQVQRRISLAFAGFRERLHGLTASVSVYSVRRQIGAVIDFGNVKAVCKAVCKTERTLYLPDTWMF